MVERFCRRVLSSKRFRLARRNCLTSAARVKATTARIVMNLFSDDADPLNPDRPSWLAGWHRGSSAPVVVKTAKGVGYVQSSDPPFARQSYALWMVWTKEGGCWRGNWKWFMNVQAKSRRKDDFLDRCQAPPELLLLVCEHVATGVPPQKTTGRSRRPQQKLPSNEETLHLALTCKASFKICAPTLYRSLDVPSHDIEEFVHFLRDRAMHIPLLASRLTISGLRPWSAYLRLARLATSLLPHVTAISMECPSLHANINPAFSQIMYPHITPLLRREALNVRYLILKGCSFATSRDLLHLLHSFPSLTDVRLELVYSSRLLPSSSRGPSAVPPTQLKTIHIGQCRPMDLPSAVYASWAWERSLSDRFPGGFPGIHETDTRVMIDICRCLRSNAELGGTHTQTVHLDAGYTSQTWVAWLACDFCHIEFHLVCPESAVDGGARRPRARVCHIVLRLRQLANPEPAPDGSLQQYFVAVDDRSAGRDGIMMMGEHLRRLSDLNEFHLETSLQVSLIPGPRPDVLSGWWPRRVPGQSRTDALVEANPTDYDGFISRRKKTTCGEARQRALSAKGGEAVPGPISPFWHESQYEDQWAQWLHRDAFRRWEVNE